MDMKRRSKIKKQNGFMKGQAMMEYLMTYGLALVAILLVLAILFTVVLPALKPPETCQFTQSANFGCTQKQHVVLSDTTANRVRLIFQLDNGQGRPVRINSVMCSTAPPGNLNREIISRYSILRNNVSLTAGESRTFGNNPSLPCYDLDTGQQATLSPNSNFKGSIGIIYAFQDEVAGAPPRIAVASVSGVVQQESGG